MVTPFQLLKSKIDKKIRSSSSNLFIERYSIKSTINTRHTYFNKKETIKSGISIKQ